MLMDEYGIPLAVRSPSIAALHIYCVSNLRVVSVGALPIWYRTLVYAIRTFDGDCLLCDRLLKSRWSTSSWWHSGFTTLLVGGIAASLAYRTGVIIERLLG
jgi:hypothetical protein